MIYLNLIPSNLWFINLRSMLSKNDWNELSTLIREASNWTCYCCNRTLKQLKKKQYFHAHEYWIFNSETKIFKLAAIVCVCYKCHQVIHYGYSSSKISKKELNSWLGYVNKWNQQECNNYLEGSFEQWAYNSTLNWTFDLKSLDDWLDDNQIKQVIEFFNKKKINLLG